MIAVGEAAWQDNGRVGVLREGVGVPDDLDVAHERRTQCSRGLSFAVRARKLHHCDAGRHTPSVCKDISVAARRRRLAAAGLCGCWASPDSKKVMAITSH